MFAPGQTWTDVLDADNFTAVSTAYDLSDLQLAADGTVTVVAVPVPEPSTWAMLVLGLLAIGTHGAAARARAHPAERSMLSRWQFNTLIALGACRSCSRWSMRTLFTLNRESQADLTQRQQFVQQSVALGGPVSRDREGAGRARTARQ